MIAYSSNDPEVILAWEAYSTAATEGARARSKLADRVGRRMMLRRFAGDTEAVGFEVFPSDAPGDLLFDGALRVDAHRVLRPNLRRKSGRALEEEMRRLTIRPPTLPGMPKDYLHGSGIFSSPGMWQQRGDDDTVYVYWDATPTPVGEQWTLLPLSTYYTEKEKYDAAVA